MVMMFNAILTVSQFQFIKPFCTGVHLPTPSLSTRTISCNLLPWAACWQLLVLQLLHCKGSRWWFTSQRISSDLMTHFCSPTCPQNQLCLPVRGWLLYAEQEQKSLIAVLRGAMTSCWEWILPCFCTFENKAKKGHGFLVSLYMRKAPLYHSVWIGLSKNIIRVKTCGSKSSAQSSNLQNEDDLCSHSFSFCLWIMISLHYMMIPFTSFPQVPHGAQGRSYSQMEYWI